MDTKNFSSEIPHYLALFRQWWWLLLMSSLLAASSALAWSLNTTPVYRATSLALVNEATGTKTTVDMAALQISERLARTYVELMTTRPVLQEVISELNLPLSDNDLRSMITITPLRDTQLIRVAVEDIHPARAAAIANQVVITFARQNLAEQAQRFAASKQSLEFQLTQLDGQIQSTTAVLNQLGSSDSARAERDRLEAVLAQYQATYTSLLQKYEEVRVTETQSTSSLVLRETAQPPAEPIRPRTLQNTLIAAVLGLALAMGGIIFTESLDNTLKTPEEAHRLLNLPIIGYLGEMPRNRNDGYTVHVADHPRSPVSEAFRTLRTNLEFASVDRPIQTLLISSPAPTEGKTTIAVNLATAMVQSGKQVALVDADLRRPSVHKYLKLPNNSGLSDLFRGHTGQLGISLKPTAGRLAVITSGPLPPNPAELLGSNRMGHILEDLKSQVDIVIIDSPPFVVSDPAVLAARVDGVLLVIEAGTTKLDAALATLEQLERAGARIVGAAFNRLTRKHVSYYNKSLGAYEEPGNQDGRPSKNGRGTSTSTHEDSQPLSPVRVYKAGLPDSPGRKEHDAQSQRLRRLLDDEKHG